MKKQRNKLNNKGFSLVELIAVIAIMAVLVGVVSPQVIKYIEKSREAADQSNMETLESAVEMALTNEAAYKAVRDEVDKFEGDKTYTVDITNPSGSEKQPTVKFEGETFGDSSDDMAKELMSIITKWPSSKAKDTNGFLITIKAASDDSLAISVTTK